MDYVPASLYKYLPRERASDVLGKLLIRFSQVSVMNDKEEFKPPIKELAAQAEFEKKFIERANVLYPGLMDLVPKSGVKFAFFVQIWPKIGHLCLRFMQ